MHTLVGVFDARARAGTKRSRVTTRGTREKVTVFDNQSERAQATVPGASRCARPYPLHCWVLMRPRAPWEWSWGPRAFGKPGEEHVTTLPTEPAVPPDHRPADGLRRLSSREAWRRQTPAKQTGGSTGHNQLFHVRP